VDFKKACKCYVQLSNKLKNPKKVRQLVVESYKLLQWKRSKLSTGKTTFTFKRFYYYDILVATWFEMEYLTQPNAKEEARKKINSVMTRLDWAWDFKNVFLLVIILLMCFNFIYAELSNFYYNYVDSTYTAPFIRVMIDFLFHMVDTKWSGTVAYRDSIEYGIQLAFEVAVFTELY